MWPLTSLHGVRPSQLTVITLEFSAVAVTLLGATVASVKRSNIWYNINGRMLLTSLGCSECNSFTPCSSIPHITECYHSHWVCGVCSQHWSLIWSHIFPHSNTGSGIANCLICKVRIISAQSLLIISHCLTEWDCVVVSILHCLPQHSDCVILYYFNCRIFWTPWEIKFKSQFTGAENATHTILWSSKHSFQGGGGFHLREPWLRWCSWEYEGKL